jgi:predicted patatin/cPLA2 family phospholipase
MGFRVSILRRFVEDPLLSRPRSVLTDPPGHPTVELISRRRDSGSLPGHRDDGRRVALVIEGGGMRGVVSAGMTAAIEQLGLADSFDEVHGASAGAFNAAFLIARQASYLTGLYQHGFGNPTFVSFRRLLRGRPVFNMDYVVNEVWRSQRPLHTERILQSAIELHCTATDVERAEVVDLTDLRDDAEIRQAMLASARLPGLAGGPVRFRGRLLLDATLAESVPVHAARSTATDLLVLQTRPEGVSHAQPSGPLAKLADRYLAGLNPALVELRRTRSARYDALIERLTLEAADPRSSPRVCIVRPVEPTAMISQVESRVSALAGAGAAGFRAAWMALEGGEPELLSVPIAFR